MLNVDKYREDIMSKGADAARLDCHIAALRGVGIRACRNDLCKACMRESFKWLFSEYEPPLLENGDGLQPDDWVMVRDEVGHAWKKRCFMCCKNGYFITTEGECSIGSTGRYEAWQQARLPMEGE